MRVARRSTYCSHNLDRSQEKRCLLEACLRGQCGHISLLGARSHLQGAAMSGTRSMCVIAMHFPPEIGAAAKRMQTIVGALACNGYSVQVVTHLPNYPQRRIYAGYRRRLVSE